MAEDIYGLICYSMASDGVNNRKENVRPSESQPAEMYKAPPPPQPSIMALLQQMQLNQQAVRFY